MEIESIKQIRAHRDSIRANIKSLDKKDFSSTTFGRENEYTFKEIIVGVSALLTDISTLTKAPKKFVQLSTYTERKQIINSLKNIDNFIAEPDYYWSDFENLKIMIRNYAVRNFSDRQIEFESEIEEVLKTKLQFEEELAKVGEIHSDFRETEELIDDTYESSNKKLEELEEELNGIRIIKDRVLSEVSSLEEKNETIESIELVTKETLENIKESASESKSNEKLIESFANRVKEREDKLTQLEQKTKENDEKLDVYEGQRNAIIKEAEALIESAKLALNYKTAEGISASFQEQYRKSSHWKFSIGWIVGALACLGVTIGLGAWVLNASESGLGIIIGRVSLLPFPIIGAIFCANQYTKQKNIIEDYAYKMVLSRAIVGFSEQLKANASGDNEEYVHYIKTALEEIHKDPLRKREVKSKKKEEGGQSNLTELVELAEKIVNISKTAEG